MAQFIDIILNLDLHLAAWTQMLGPWMYVLLFLIIFCETGLVITPFLPGDSLLFAVGAITAIESSGLSLPLILALLVIAGILGDSTNYSIGNYLGPKVFASRKSRVFNQEYLFKTQAFYEKYGAITIVIARFAPIVRTFAPFVAGIGKMDYKRFLFYNVAGAILWVFIFVLAGYFFGNLPIVKRNFHIVIFGVIFVSILPMLYAWVQAQLDKRKNNSTSVPS